MSRNTKIKELPHTRLANQYGGWIYCESCGENIGYLCYTTYDNFIFNYQCQCGSCGHIHIAFGDINSKKISNDKLIKIKNRLCCIHDQSPLLTILKEKLISYQYEIDCLKCQSKYKGEK